MPGVETSENDWGWGDVAGYERRRCGSRGEGDFSRSWSRGCGWFGGLSRCWVGCGSSCDSGSGGAENR